METKKENFYTMYVFIKLLLIFGSLYLFVHPDIFAEGGYGLAIDGVVICRGISLFFALHTFSSLLDLLIDKYKI